MRTYNLSNKAFFKILKAYIEIYGNNPTYEELIEYTGLRGSTSIQYHLSKLEKLGLLEYQTETKVETILRIKLKEN